MVKSLQSKTFVPVEEREGALHPEKISFRENVPEKGSCASRSRWVKAEKESLLQGKKKRGREYIGAQKRGEKRHNVGVRAISPKKEEDDIACSLLHKPGEGKKRKRGGGTRVFR